VPLTTFLFDLDGVVTRTARVHAAAWKRLFDDYLARRASDEGRAFVPFDAVSARGVEKPLARLPGVRRVEVNSAGGSATVVYDETAITLASIKARVEACGYNCSGELTPKHVCAPEDPPTAAASAAPLAGHVAPEAVAHAGHAKLAACAGEMDSTAHEMGHGAGMDMQAMVRDMRTRFWICLAFAVPILIYSPMGGMFTPPAPPFGLPLNVWLFFLASGAVLYPGWPFVVAAWRCHPARQQDPDRWRGAGG